MNSAVNRQWLLKQRPEREVAQDHFDLVTTTLVPPEPGQVLIKNEFLSFEPAQRGWLNDLPSYIAPVKLGEVMRAMAVGTVLESKHPDYQIGDRLMGGFGWQDYYRGDGQDLVFPIKAVQPDIPISYPLHIYGLTGMTAYFGLFDIGQPSSGDTVAISGAAGATGSVVGQMAKIKGCRVIGIAGGEKKCAWLKQELGFDEAIDYRNEDVHQRLNELCKNKIDIFFDNVGGAILDQALVNIAIGARVVLCGGISSGYHGKEVPPGPANYMQLVIRRSRMEGFLVLDYLDKFPQAIAEMQGWVDAGLIKVKEDIVDGLEQCPQVLAGLFKGNNFGKQLVRV